MPKIDSYKAIGGFAPHTSSIKNVLVHQGFPMPGEQGPVNEALLFGLSGGAAFGYFQFAYEKVDPQINILTRNTFNNYGWDVLTSRLGLAQDVIHSTTEAKAEKKLMETLEQGLVPIVWADVFTLGYEHSEMGEGMWAMQPMVVFEYDGSADRVLISDRALVPIEVGTKTFLAAWGKVKKDRYKMITLQQVSPPDWEQVICDAMADCRSLYLEKPPRGSANNFGFKAYDAIIKDLRGSHAKSWQKFLSSPRSLAAGLISAYKYSMYFWKDNSRSGDRELFAEFLYQAGEILGESRYQQSSEIFLQSAQEWKKLGGLFLPDEDPVLGQLKSAFRQRESSFREKGTQALPVIKELEEQMANLLEQANRTPQEAIQQLENIAGQFEIIRDLERKAVEVLG